MNLRLILTIILLCFSISSQSLAHTGMTATSPGDGETVQGEVSNIALSFSDPVRITLVKLVHRDANESVEPTSELPPAFVQTVEAEVPPLEPGAYDVQWTAVSKDGHVVTGAFSFTVVE
jgi:methionine-rich copper-binding protein CopC